LEFGKQKFEISFSLYRFSTLQGSRVDETGRFQAAGKLESTCTAPTEGCPCWITVSVAWHPFAARRCTSATTPHTW
jgi:hypothetical protein